jgi:hypothetical protein
VRAPRVSTVVGAGFVVWGLAIGLAPLHDNSFLTHLSTGRLIVAHGVPRNDPYSFTAPGDTWVVESWLASFLYGLTERVAGGHGLQVLHAAATAALAALVWALTRPARQLPGRAIAAVAALVVGSGYWSPRPLLLALVLLAGVILMAETEGGRPWMLVPLMWVWVNVHGSWPLGLVYLALRMAGRRADGTAMGRLPRLAGAAVVGSAAGAVNPVGAGLLTYPWVVLSRHQAFAHIAEWQPPSFTDPLTVLVAAEVVLVAVLLVVRRGTVEDALVTVVFAAGATLAARNLPVAALVVTPVLARGLAGLGTVAGVRRGRVPAAALVVWGAAGALALGGALQAPAYDLAAYPVAEVTWMQRHALVPGPTIAPDYVGNYLEFRFGPRAQVFLDDRVDLFPSGVEGAYGTLLHGAPGWRGTLDTSGAAALLWPRNLPLAHLVAGDRRWAVVVRDRRWVVAVPVQRAVARVAVGGANSQVRG